MKKTYENSVSKRYIQKLLLTPLKDISRSALILAGPNVLEYCTFLLDNTKLQKLYSYEQDFTTYYKQLTQQYSNRFLKQKVLFRIGAIDGAITEHTIHNYIDLDFCCWLATCRSTIVKLFNKQTQLATTERRVFQFTISYMRDVNWEFKLITFLNKELKLNLSPCFWLKLEQGSELFLNCAREGFIVRILKYSDTSSMAVVQIIY